MTFDVESAPKSRERPPSLLACTTCRNKHLRCDAQMPVCGRCSYRQTPCVYLGSKRGYRPRKKQNGSGASTSDTGSEAQDGTVPGMRYNQEDHSRLIAYPKASTIDNGTKMYTPATTASPTESNSSVTGFDGQQKQPEVYNTQEDLIDVFYKSFFLAHGFVIPRKLLLECPRILPEELKAVMRYVGSHYQPGSPKAILRTAASEIMSEDLSIAPGFVVQGRLCLAMVLLAGSSERALGMRVLESAVDVAVSSGLYCSDYANGRMHDHPMLTESWRRTWWDLFVVDTLLSALDGSNYKSKLQHVHSDIPLPGRMEDYINCIWTAPAPTLDEMRDRLFAESPHNYSSGAYKIEAARILATVLKLESHAPDISDTQVEAVDASIQAFILSLPLSFREILEMDGKVDEVLFAAHMVIHWASIALHRPRADLKFIRNHYKTACSPDEKISFPSLSFQSHTAKAICAANLISNLTALRTPLTLHSPCFICAIALAATVHLPAYTLQENQPEMRERLHLSVSALASIGEVWPFANVVRGQIANFARETLKSSSVPLLTPADPSKMTAMIDSSRRPLDIDLDAMLNDDSWLNDLDVFASMPIDVV